MSTFLACSQDSNASRTSVSQYDRSPDGRTVGDVWRSLGTSDKRDWLIDHRWTILARRDAEREVIVIIVADEFLSEVMSLQKL